MRRSASLVVLCVIYAFAWNCSASAQIGPVLVFEHVNVIDGVSTEPLRDVTVVVREGKIETIGAPVTNLPRSAQHIDLSGHWMLPGLIDVHVHPFTLEGAQNMRKAGVTTGEAC